MANITRNANRSRRYKLYYILTFLCRSKLCWWILLLMFIMSVIHYNEIPSYAEFSRILTDSGYINSISSFFQLSKTATSSAAPLIITTTDPPEVVIEIDARKPSFKLATKVGDKPYANDDRAQARMLDQLNLYEVCQRDPSTIVVDVGAYLGDFGLYAAACGCTVYLFEIRSDMITLIRSSIKHNSFSSSNVHLFTNAVSDLPSNSIINYSPGDGSTTNIEDSITVETIRLDDISWSSSSIFLLKVDVEGFELNVLRSAKNLFAEKRIHHLIFKYTPWLAERASQEKLLPYVRNTLRPRFMYVLSRAENNIYGPLLPIHLTSLYDEHLRLHLQTNFYAVFDSKVARSSIKSQPYKPNTL